MDTDNNLKKSLAEELKEITNSSLERIEREKRETIDSYVKDFSYKIQEGMREKALRGENQYTFYVQRGKCNFDLPKTAYPEVQSRIANALTSNGLIVKEVPLKKDSAIITIIISW